MRTFLLRLKALLRRRQLDSDLHDEVAFHLQMKQERGQVSAGEARRSFGNPGGWREACRDLWSFGSVEVWWQDLRYGARVLRRSPGFTVVAILTLALGIGGNTAIFSLVHSLLLKSLPVRDAQQLRLLTWIGGENVPAGTISGYGDYDEGTKLQTSGSFSYPTYLALRDRLADSADVFAFRALEATASTGTRSEFVRAQLVSGNYFRALGSEPMLGRSIEASDDRAAAPLVSVISYRFWLERFGQDRGALGATVAVNGKPATIVGILPPAMAGLDPGERVDVYVPIEKASEFTSAYDTRDNTSWWVQIFARLSHGAAESNFRAAADVIFRQMALADVTAAQKKPDIPQMVVQAGDKGIRFRRPRLAKPLMILSMVVGLVLLIACANLANLMFARAASRRREFAVRVSIGAGRGRLVRQLLTESLLLSLAGGALGVALARPLALLVFRAGAANSGLEADPGVDAAVLFFTAGVALAAALLFGLAPALRSTRVDLSGALKESSAGSRGGGAGLRIERLVVAAQVSLSVLLLVGAGLFIRTLAKLSDVPLGFQPSHVLTFRMNPVRNGYRGDRLLDLYARIRSQIATLPGVESVALSHVALIGGSVDRTVIQVPGYTPPPGTLSRAWFIIASDGFLPTMGIPVVQGRDLAPSDDGAAPLAAVVNETFARRYLAGANPVGRTFLVNKRPVQIVGVSKDAKYDSVKVAVVPTTYISYRQYKSSVGSMIFNVRTAGSPLEFAGAVRRVVTGIDPQLPLADVRSSEQQIAESIGPERFAAAFVGAFGVLAAVLAAIGLYGVIAYAVSRRTAEIGIRMALGARRPEVQWLVMRESLVLVLAGLPVGIAAALMLTRLIRSALFEVGPADPISFFAGPVGMLAVACFAAWLPARRAAKVDPLVALRYE